MLFDKPLFIQVLVDNNTLVADNIYNKILIIYSHLQHRLLEVKACLR